MKKDKGIELIYYKLSYRRKFIRTLWWTPIAVIALALIWRGNYNIIFKIITTIVLILINLIQLIYTYNKWKNNDLRS